MKIMSYEEASRKQALYRKLINILIEKGVISPYFREVPLTGATHPNLKLSEVEQ